MTDDELEDLLDDMEAALREDVQAALTLTADEFAEAVSAATELVAAPFSVSRIRDMWNRRVPGIMTRLRAIMRRGAEVGADDAGAPQDERPSASDLDDALAAYDAATVAQLEGVGERLAEAARTVLNSNPDMTLDELKAELIRTFSDEGTQLGPGRAERIAATQAVSAFNAGALAAAQAVTGPDRPLVKQWLTRNDERVRPSHRDANGQIQLLDEPFQVGTSQMQFPGDPSAPASETVNCRCVMRTQSAAQPQGEQVASADDDFQSRMPPQLKEYWLAGPGAARIGWGTPGSFTRCVRELRDDFPQDPEGLCANLYHEATGRWPGARRAAVDKDGNPHSGAMVALVPSDADAQRLAVDGGEPWDQLHVTLAYLGDADNWSRADRDSLTDAVESMAAWTAPVRARIFGAAQWNPDGDEPAWVWNVGDDHETPGAVLGDVHGEMRYTLEGFDLPRQHSPWVAHVAATYGDADMAALAERVGPVTFDRIAVAFGGEWALFDLAGQDAPEPEPMADLVEAAPPPRIATWSTPAPAALAYEDQQTGDGRVFAPGALYWDGEGPWPLKYAHEGETLAGAIYRMAMDDGRLDGSGVLYLDQPSGLDAALMLAQSAPLGVSVDLDDVEMELVDATGEAGEFNARFVTASVLPLPGGGYRITGETAPDLTASGVLLVEETARVVIITDGNGRVPKSAFEVTAAVGGTAEGGVVVETQSTGDYLMRITRARVRGASLVTIPAFATARIVLDDPSVMGRYSGVPIMAASTPDTDETTGDQMRITPSGTGQDGDTQDDVSAALKTTTNYDRVLRHVRASKAPVGAARLAQALKLPVAAAQKLLAQAAARGEVVKLTRGLYTDKATSARADHVMIDDQLTASAIGAVDLPVAPREREWDGDDAMDHVFAWADGDVERISRAFAYRDDDADPMTKAAYKLGYADVVDGTLTIIPRGVSAAQGAMSGARGGVDLPPGERAAVQDRLDAVSAHVDEVLGTDERDSMEASAWKALADLPPMPAEWFREPTAEELPPGGPGVNYSNGRIFGWVAQSDEPHAGFAKRVVINELGKIDTSHFLRQRFSLDDGTTVKAGAFTMNVGHHRDGAECETSACQFDDTRTVAGIVTVGMNERGLWFSGAAAPWLSEWDRSVFAATQPSYHMKRGSNGQWQLRAVLAVPVPGHSSPLLASAVIERAQMALTAAATMAEVEDAVAAEEAVQAAEAVVADAAVQSATVEAVIDYDRLAAAMVAAMDARDERRAREAAELEALLAEGRTMNTDTGTKGE